MSWISNEKMLKNFILIKTNNNFFFSFISYKCAKTLEIATPSPANEVPDQILKFVQLEIKYIRNNPKLHYLGVSCVYLVSILQENYIEITIDIKGV